MTSAVTEARQGEHQETQKSNRGRDLGREHPSSPKPLGMSGSMDRTGIQMCAGGSVEAIVQKGKKSYSGKIRPSSRDRSHNQINADSRKEGALCPGRTGGARGLCTLSARLQVAVKTCYSIRASQRQGHTGGNPKYWVWLDKGYWRG